MSPNAAGAMMFVGGLSVGGVLVFLGVPVAALVLVALAMWAGDCLRGSRDDEPDDWPDDWPDGAA